MIVKVQLSLMNVDFANPNVKQPQAMLVYNKKRNFRYEGPVTDEIKNSMGGKLKEFFNAELIPVPGDPSKKIINITSRAPWQQW